MSGAEIATTISTTDFQQYWKRVDERTSSSFSGVIFSHYKAVASHLMLLSMHAAYLTACARRGIPLARWGIGLTVLQEKIVGNNFVHKLRAICLLEADFNWINKIIFAKWMMVPLWKEIWFQANASQKKAVLHQCCHDKNIHLRRIKDSSPWRLHSRKWFRGLLQSCCPPNCCSVPL